MQYHEIENIVEEYYSKNGNNNLAEKIYSICENKADYIKRNLLLKYIFSVKDPATFCKRMLNQIENDYVYDQTLVSLITSLGELDSDKLAVLKTLQKIIDIDVKILTKIIKKQPLDINHLLNISYNDEEESYDISTSTIYKFIESGVNGNELSDAIKIFQTYRNKINFAKISKNLTINEFLKYPKYESHYYDILFSKAKSSIDKWNILFNKYFNCSFQNVLIIMKKVEELEAQNKVEGYNFFKMLINENVDVLYNTIKTENFDAFRDFNMSFMAYCCNDITNKLKSTTKLEGTDNVYDISNQPFTILIHRTKAVLHDVMMSDEDFYTLPIADGKTTISCSLLSDMYLGRVEDNEEDDAYVYFGFNNISPDLIVDMGPKDLYHSSDIIGNDVPSSARGNDYYDADNLILNSFYQYNEVCLFREDQFTQERTKPDYIICFDKIDEHSKKMAKKLNLPIYFVDTRVVYAKGREKLKNMVNDQTSYSSATKNLKVLKSILSFAYGAYCSFREEIDKNLLQEFLNKTKESPYLTDKYKQKAETFATNRNNEIGFGLADCDRYTLHNHITHF